MASFSQVSRRDPILKWHKVFFIKFNTSEDDIVHALIMIQQEAIVSVKSIAKQAHLDCKAKYLNC